MPINFYYDNKKNALYETGYGVLALTDFFEYRKKVQTLPMKKDLKILSNYLEASLQFKIREMEEYARMSEDLPIKYGTVKLAICANDHLTYGMARMFSSISEINGLNIEVFKDLSSAQNWLGIEK